MFELNDKEKQALANLEDLQKKIVEATKANRSFSLDPKTKAELEGKLEDLAKQAEAAETDPDVFKAGVKSMLRKEIEKNIPGGNVNAVLDIVDDTLDSDEVGHLGSILYELLLNFFEFIGDEGLCEAKAKATANQYRAYTIAGIDPNFAKDLMIAHAGRPMNFSPNLGSKK